MKYNIKKLKEQGCEMWDKELLLFTPEILKRVKNGDILYDINGDKIIVGETEKKEDFDYDTRFLCTAYGIKIN